MTSKGSGVITIGNVGGAVIPPLFGCAVRSDWQALCGMRPRLCNTSSAGLADKVGIQYAFLLPIVCYLFVAYYGLVGVQAGARGKGVEGGFTQVFLKALRLVPEGL